MDVHKIDPTTLHRLVQMTWQLWLQVLDSRGGEAYASPVRFWKPHENSDRWAQLGR